MFILDLLHLGSAFKSTEGIDCDICADFHHDWYSTPTLQHQLLLDVHPGSALCGCEQ